jgi:hypothetical protein
MAIIVHHPDDLSEGFKVRPFLRPESIVLEELDNLGEIIQFSNPVIHPVTVVRSDASTSEEIPDPLEQHHIAFVLCHSELGKDLPSQAHLLYPIDSNVEASFTIYETSNPARI